MLFFHSCLHHAEHNEDNNAPVSPTTAQFMLNDSDQETRVLLKTLTKQKPTAPPSWEATANLVSRHSTIW